MSTGQEEYGSGGESQGESNAMLADTVLYKHRLKELELSSKEKN